MRVDMRVFVCVVNLFFSLLQRMCEDITVLVLRFFYKIYGKWEKSPSLTLSGCIQKILKRSETLISDVHGRDLSIDAVYL